MTLKVFVDTEFTNFIDTDLISIGMAAGSGEEFYAEVQYPVANCSPFVREAVIPLLGQIPDAFCTIDDLYLKITSWLNIIRSREEDVEICFDYQTDWDLFSVALDGHVPSWCKPRLIGRNINELLRYKFHKDNNLPEHYALYDAQANRYAFRERPPVSS